MWDTNKTPNFQIIRINKSQEFQVNDIYQIFHKTTEKKVPCTKETHTHTNTRCTQDTK